MDFFFCKNESETHCSSHIYTFSRSFEKLFIISKQFIQKLAKTICQEANNIHNAKCQVNLTTRTVINCIHD